MAGEPASLRVLCCVLHTLEPFTESSDRATQCAAEQALETAVRNLVEHDPERFVDPVSGALLPDGIQRYILKTVRLKRLGAWRFGGPSLDQPRPGGGTMADTIADADSPSAEDTLLDALDAQERELRDLQELAADRETRRVAEQLRLVVLEEWLATHTDEVSPAEAEVVLMRAAGLEFLAIADRIKPDASHDAAGRARARRAALTRFSRARRKLPPHIDALLPPRNSRGGS